ncbi:nuclear pore membrane glycoprotein 210 [Cylas formicarius]|uniref:nuclear pore membrane glycoprotein 210 n=1 Tax=Cylas formicarius TaxID=197179 RepID=UPI002958DA59|nr:nuclear pore membrane glycoprotein 210 [Cylas formicarius]
MKIMAILHYRLLHVLFILSLVFAASASKLNVPRVLLPIFNDFSTQFVLEATEGGCYRWSTTRADIIQLTLIGENKELTCSTKVVVSTITREAARNIAVVLAEDINTKQNLRCDVIVDVIHSLAISTTTKELFMEEAPENFEVKAYDDQGNEFSSLESIEFDWTIIPLGPNKDNVIRYITYRDSPYETPPAIEALENQNKKGYSILLEGVKSGSAKVAVRLPYPEYKHVAANEVQLMIVANLLISPAEVYVMPGDVVSFKIFFLNGGRMEEITLPDSQYYIEAEDSEIASSVKNTGSVTALQEGKTRIVLRDRNIGKDDPMLKLPAATIHVSAPEYILLNILPHKNWAVLIEQRHDIIAEVYSSTDHKLYLGEAVQVFIEVTPEFHVLDRTANGTWISGYGVKSGVARIQASLEGVLKGKELVKVWNRIIARTDLMIYPQITIEPSEVILPWDPTTRPKYDIDLVAKGGDGRFLWSSSDNSVGIVSQSGHVRTLSNGFFEVSAVMMRNHDNRQSAKVIILPPSRLEIVEFVMEAEVGSPVYLHIALYAETSLPDGKTIMVPFTRCQELPFQVKQSDVKFKHNKTAVLAPIGISCGNIAMVGLNVGTSKVTVSYYQDGTVLEDSVTISAFRPLQLLQPRRDIVLAVGSSINVVYTGGPRPIIGRSSEHQRVIVSENESIVQAQDNTPLHSIPGEDFTVVQVLCRKIGETDIKLMISNTPSSANCQTRTSTLTTRVVCGKPRKITLQPQLKIADTSACPMDLGSGNVIVQCTKVIDVDVVLFDESGNRFLNFTSLNLHWAVYPFDSGILLSKDSIFPKNITLGTVMVADKSFQSFMPYIDVGQITINVTALGYIKSILNKNLITAEWPEFSSEEDRNSDPPAITASLSLFLVENTELSSKSLTIFNHPGNKKTIPVLQGSGFFELALSADDIVDVRYVEGTKELEITPLKSGEVLVQLLDLCLVSKPATLTVNVISIGIIRIDMPDKVEIGKCIPCIVRLYDENDNLMDIPDLGMIDLRPEFEEKIANIERAKEDPKEPWGNGEIHYIVTGVDVGDTKLIFIVSGNDEDVNSAPMDLQVFQPLKLHPRNGTILIGSSVQLIIRGGPQPDTNIQFLAVNNKTAIASDKGIVTGRSIGTTKIKAWSVGIHPSTGQNIVYSEDTVEITVVALQGVKIAAPLLRFRVGATVPFWCFGVPDISPVVLGTAIDPSLVFRWRVDDKLLADLTGIFYPLGIDIGRPDRVVLKLTGLQAGSTRVFVNVTTPGIVANVASMSTIMYSAFVDIEIVDEFHLNRPVNIQGSSLLMAPFSQLQLETNMDSITKIVYALPNNQGPSTELLADNSVYQSEKQIVSLSSTGLLKSFGIFGHALLIITSIDEHGLKQYINIVVEVKPIQYMNLNIHAYWRISFNNLITTIPLGTDFMLVASYHDNIGNTFHAGPTDLKIRTSRCDLMKVTQFPENGSIWISTKKPGHTMLKVWADGIQQTTDYLKINVEQSVKPLLDHLTSGDTICLWTPVISQYNLPGSWKSSDGGLMDINPALDIGFVGNKVGTVTLVHSLLPSAPIHIPVYPVKVIEFLTKDNIVLTNGERDSVSRFILVLQSEKSVGVKTNNLIQGWRCRQDIRKMVRPQGFKCFMEFSNKSASIAPHDLFALSNSWVPETGQYACKIINLNVNNTKVALLNTNLSLWVTTEDETVESEKLNIKFLPGVHVEKYMSLEDSSNTGEMVVKGLPEVLGQISVLPADSSILYVSETKSSDDYSKKFKIQLIDYHWRLANMEDAMGIIVLSPITKQHEKVLVRVTTDSTGQMCGVVRSPILSFMRNYKYALVMAVVMIVVFLMTFYFYSNYMQPIVNVNVSPGRTVLGPSPSPGFPRNAINVSPSLNRTSPNVSPGSCKFNCTCARHASRDPIYGDASTFYNSSPEIRRNRKYM